MKLIIFTVLFLFLLIKGRLGWQKRKKWSDEHKKNWKEHLENSEDGLSIFQTKIENQVKSLLNDYSLTAKRKITKHLDLDDKTKEVKLISLRINELNSSEIWIYHDQAEYDIDGTHHTFEGTGYLKPIELELNFLDNLKEKIKLATTKPISNATT